MEKQTVKINFLETVEIMASKFTVIWDKETDGGGFSWETTEITIGIKNYDIDPLYVLSIISHEVMELLLTTMGGRFNNRRTFDNYLFNFDHQTFETAIQIHAAILSKFINYNTN